MSNEIAAQLTQQAMQHFDEIDSKHTGALNLASIMAYEQKGPEQKQVGQFLQDNYDTVRGILGADEEQDAGGYITRDELSLVNLLAGANQPALKAREVSDTIAAGIGGAIIAGEVGILPSVVIGGVSGFAVGPAAPLVAIGADAVAAGAGYLMGYRSATNQYSKMQAEVNQMRL